MTEPLPGVPRKDETPADQLRALWAAVDELRQQGMRNSGMSGGLFELTNDAEFQVTTSAGVQMFRIGMLLNTVTGVLYRGFLLRRPDGSAFLYTNVVTEDPNLQYLALADQNDVTVLTTDAFRGGLAKPWLSLPSTALPGNGDCTSTFDTFVSVHTTGYVQFKQQPIVRAQACLRSLDGGEGEARFTVNGTPMGTVMVIAAGAYGWRVAQDFELPGALWVDNVNIELQIRRTSTVGSVAGVQAVTQRGS